MKRCPSKTSATVTIVGAGPAGMRFMTIRARFVIWAAGPFIGLARGKGRYRAEPRCALGGRRAALTSCGLRIETDLRNEKIGHKIREHSLAKVPMLLVVGKREAKEGTVSRRRTNAPLRLAQSDRATDKTERIVQGAAG